MWGLEAPASDLGGRVVRAAVRIWLGRTKSEADRSASVMIGERVESEFDRRRLRRRLDMVEGAIADQLQTDASGTAMIADNERIAAVQAVTDTLDSAQLTVDDLFEADLDPTALSRFVSARVPQAAAEAGSPSRVRPSINSCSTGCASC